MKKLENVLDIRKLNEFKLLVEVNKSVAEVKNGDQFYFLSDFEGFTMKKKYLGLQKF